MELAERMFTINSNSFENQSIAESSLHSSKQSAEQWKRLLHSGQSEDINSNLFDYSSSNQEPELSIVPIPQLEKKEENDWKGHNSPLKNIVSWKLQCDCKCTSGWKCCEWETETKETLTWWWSELPSRSNSAFTILSSCWNTRGSKESTDNQYNGINDVGGHKDK